MGRSTNDQDRLGSWRADRRLRAAQRRLRAGLLDCFERGGSQIGGRCHIRFDTTAFACLRMLVFRGDELSKERDVLAASRPVAAVGCTRQCNQRPVVGRRLRALRIARRAWGALYGVLLRSHRISFRTRTSHFVSAESTSLVSRAVNFTRTPKTHAFSKLTK